MNSEVTRETITGVPGDISKLTTGEFSKGPVTPSPYPQFFDASMVYSPSYIWKPISNAASIILEDRLSPEIYAPTMAKINKNFAYKMKISDVLAKTCADVICTKVNEESFFQKIFASKIEKAAKAILNDRGHHEG